MSEGFDLVAAFEEFFAQALGEERAVVSFRERRGKQGASGSSIRYFKVQTESAGKGRRSDKLVVKDAGALERLVVSLLKGQGCAVPPAWIGPESRDGGPVVMPFLEEFDERGMRPSPRLAADALTGIHVANLGLPPYWLPAVQADPKGLLWLTTGEDLWQQALADPDFASEFDRYSRRLARAMQRFLRAIEHLAAEGDTLTLLAVDLLPDEVRFWRERAAIIDWEHAAYWSLYLDLPNQFTFGDRLGVPRRPGSPRI